MKNWKEVLHKIKPSKEEQTQFANATAQFLARINNILSDATAILGGSGAKGTWLSGSYDTDVFVLYDYNKYKQQSPELSVMLEKTLKKAFPAKEITKLHGSRDYFQIKEKNHVFEVVPILKITKAEQALNITDVSPLHAKWVNLHTQKQKDEILLAKQFCKANGFYGAESHIGGFSGYVLEILIVLYGSFEKLLKASQKWKEKEIIDVARHYPKKDALFHLNQSKTRSPLVVIDPVDKSRNAAAALNAEKVEAFRQKAAKFLAHPSASFFEKKEISFQQLTAEHKKQNIAYLSVEPLQGKRDVVGSKLLKAFQYLQQEVEKFGLIQSGWEEKGTFYFVVQKDRVPEVEIRAGPPLAMTTFVTEFQKKNKETFKEKGRWYAKVKVLHPHLPDAVKAALKDKYIKDKIAKVKSVEFSLSP